MSDVFYEVTSIDPGSFDTRARLADLDADGIHTQVLYPSVTLAGARTSTRSASSSAIA